MATDPDPPAACSAASTRRPTRRRRLQPRAAPSSRSCGEQRLEAMNLEAKCAHRPRARRQDQGGARVKYLQSEKASASRHRASHRPRGPDALLDYDKKFLLGSLENLTFDGSSVRGFSQQSELTCASASTGSLLPAARRLLGPGKVLTFGEVLARDGLGRGLADMRSALKRTTQKPSRRAARSSTRRTRSRASSQRAATPSATTTRPASSSSSRPRVLLLAARRLFRNFIDAAAEAQRAMGFANEKDTPRSRRRSSR